MKNYFILMCLIFLVSCNHMVPEYYESGENSILLEVSQQDEHSMDTYKNVDFSNDTKTKNQQSNDDKPINNKKDEEQERQLTSVEEKITYGDIEYEDSTISFKVLDPRYDNTKIRIL